MPFSLARLPIPSSIQRGLRQLEQEVETVINVLQPGPLGIIEHKFSVEEVQRAKATVQRAVDNWRRNATLEKNTDASRRLHSGGSSR